MDKKPSIHFNERKTPISMLVFHSSAFDVEKAIKSYDDAEVSAHYLIGYDGTLVHCVDENNRAWHTGVAYWRGTENDLNSSSIGIEVLHPTLGQTPFDEAQIEKLVHFCKKIIKKHNITPENIVGHSDISPLRKPDPGLAFPWKRLAKEGIGLWYQIKNADKVLENNVETLLKSIGYDTRTKEATIASAYAFCRHFLPEYVTVDNNIQHLLDNVLPENDEFMKEAKFLKTLKAVSYSYQQALEQS